MNKEAIEFQFVSHYVDWEEIETNVVIFYDATLRTDVFPWSNPEDCYVIAISSDECFVEVSDEDGNVVENRKFKVSLI